MNPLPAHELGMIESFIAPNLRERYRLGLSKRRMRMLSRLASERDFDPRIVVPIEPRLQTAEAIKRLLVNAGAPSECFVMSRNHKWDRREVPLAEAVEGIVGRVPATLISCLPGRLAYLETESMGDRFLLRT